MDLDLAKETQRNVDSAIEAANADYTNRDYAAAIRHLRIAWDALPHPKERYSESYHIAKYLAQTHLLLEQPAEAKPWSERMFVCAPGRIDSGERDFIAAKVAFAAGDLAGAKAYLRKADQKSLGRCFEGQDKKYRDLLSSADS
ncbi:MAG: hypothetical protein H7A22_00435 [Spirochaetales bacterium]|nr:hypothetical protein [Spirochaetales bacterium]